MTRPTAGGPVDALPTPALLIDAEQLERNVAAMAAWADGTVALRPHFKAHKCLEIARLQTAAGAIGITAATVWEARALARAGIGEILLANQVVTDDKLRVMAEAAAAVPVVVALDDGDAAAAFSRALAAAGAHARALVDVDVGMGRGGVRTVDEALALAGRIAELPRLELAGVMGYEGHVVLEPDRERRAALAGEAMALLGRHAEALRDAGHAIEIVSAGGTNTHDATGPHPAVTELQAGTYALMDTAYRAVRAALRAGARHPRHRRQPPRRPRRARLRDEGHRDDGHRRHARRAPPGSRCASSTRSTRCSTCSKDRARGAGTASRWSRPTPAPPPTSTTPTTSCAAARCATSGRSSLAARDADAGTCPDGRTESLTLRLRCR